MDISLNSILLWGLIGTLVLTLIQAAGQGLHLTRMSIPLMLGTAVTGNPDRAKVYGFAVHVVNGWLFSFFYAFIFESWGRAEWWLGLVLGALHALLALSVLIPILPGLHPRMASEYGQPEAAALLEPPGFMALNYGARTPFVAFLAHLAYGAILGAFYQLAPA